MRSSTSFTSLLFLFSSSASFFSALAISSSASRNFSLNVSCSATSSDEVNLFSDSSNWKSSKVPCYILIQSSYIILGIFSRNENIDVAKLVKPRIEEERVGLTETKRESWEHFTLSFMYFQRWFDSLPFPLKPFESNDICWWLPFMPASNNFIIYIFPYLSWQRGGYIYQLHQNNNIFQFLILYLDKVKEIKEFTTFSHIKES